MQPAYVNQAASSPPITEWPARGMTCTVARLSTPGQNYNAFAGFVREEMARDVAAKL